MATMENVILLRQCVSCLRCQLLRFTEEVDMSTVLAVNSSVHGLFSLQHRDNTTSVLRLKQGCAAFLSTISIIGTGKLELDRIYWDTHSPASDQLGVFFTQDQSGSLMEFAVYSDTISLRRQLHYQPLQKAVEGYSQCTASSIELIGFEKGYLLFLVNTDTLCAAEINSNACLPCTWIPLPAQEISGRNGGQLCFQAATDTVAVLHQQAQLLFIYSLYDGQLLCQIDLEPGGFSNRTDGGSNNATAAFVPWAISTSLDRLVWVDAQGTICLLNLEDYVYSKPHLVRLPEGLQNSHFHSGMMQNLKTCHQGGFSWKQTLIDIHLQEAGHSARSTWSRQKLSQSASQRQKEQPRKISVSGFYRKQRNLPATCEVENYLKRLQFPAGSVVDVGYKVTELQCSLSTLVLTLVSGVDENQKVVCLVDFSLKQVYFHSLPNDHYPVKTKADKSPLMILSPTGLEMIVPPSEVQQEDIVSKMMVHSGAQTTDSLCKLNSWCRTSVPLHALELGLRQLQLDTVAFFLCSKESLFSGNLEGEHPSASRRHSPWHDKAHLSAVSELLPALDIFLKVISDELPGLSAPREFCMRLLIQTLEFLHGLLKDGLVRQNQLGGTEQELTERADLDRAMDVVMEYISRLREAMTAHELKQKRLSRMTSVRLAASASSDMESTDAVSADTTDVSFVLVQDLEDKVEKACRDNDTPALQAELLSLGHDAVAGWGAVVRVGLQRAWSHVQRQQISAAQFIIGNLGLDVAKSLWQLMQFTTDRRLQHYVIQQLQEAATLSKEDLSLVNVLQKLYTVYSSDSVKQSLLRKGRLIMPGASPIASHLRPVQTNVASEAKDIGCNTTMDAAGEGPYCVMTLHWLRQLDPEFKEVLLLEGALLRGESVDDGRFNPYLLWRFWLSRNQPQDAIEVLEKALTAERTMLGNCLDRYLQDLPLATGFVQHIIRTHLLRKKDSLEEIVRSLNLSVEDLLRFLKGFLHVPHPLHRCSSKILSDFHRQFAAYCAQHGFVLLLWQYCSLHDLDEESLLEVESIQDALWFKPFVCLHAAVNQRDDCRTMVAASLSFAIICWKPDHWTLAHLLKENHITAAVATLAYLPEADSGAQLGHQNLLGETAFNLDHDLLRTSLQRFPKLLSALLPPDADTSRFDINVYQLLRDNAPLDLKRLFGWQSTNTLASEDAMRALPFFSHPDLVSRFAHTAKLNFTYYLKHGRPSYAFLSFLSEELENKASTLSPKRIQGACGMALWLAVKHFHDSQISSACVAFVEMLRRDSFVLRIYIHAGETVFAHHNRNLPGSIDRRKEQLRAVEQEVVSLMQACLRNRHRHHHRYALLTRVEDAITDEIARQGLSSTSVEAALKWNLAILLCHHFRLPLSTRFLENCAREDRWLPFIWFSQLHQYPKTQLHQLLHQFPSHHLRDHLHYIITNASSNTVTSAAASGDGKLRDGCGTNATDGSRNTRSLLYSKIGVQAPVEQANESSEEEDKEALRPETAESHEPDSRLSAQDDFEVTEESAATDVFRVIFSAMATSEPWKSLLMHAVVMRNPLFAELAGCCGASIALALCAWLVAMLAPPEHACFLQQHGKRVWKWTVVQLEKLIEVYLQCHMENTLAAAFFIFQPVSPLLPFLQFTAECVMWRNYEGCKLLLDKFKDSMAAISSLSRKYHSLSDKESDKDRQPSDQGEELIGDQDWLERMAYKVVQYELVHCASLYDAVHILSLLAEENIALMFSFDVMDFNHLHRMLDILHRHQVTGIHLPNLFTHTPKEEVYLGECQKALESLMSQGAYEVAYIFGQLAGLDLSAVVFRQLASEKQQLQTLGVWDSAVIRQRYWSRCGVRCAKYQLSPATVADFFQREVDETECLAEKSALFKLSLTHLDGYQDKQHTASVGALRDQIFTSMWRYRLQDYVAKQYKVNIEEASEDIFSDMDETVSTKSGPTDREELLHSAALPRPQVNPANELNSEEAMELEIVMEDWLAEGRVSECCHLARLLGGRCTDLVIILTCIGLSTGEITVRTMDAASRCLLTTAERQPSFTSLSTVPRTVSTVSLSSSAPSWSFLPSIQEEVILTMERLLGCCKKCQPCCLRIISVYKIACLTGRTYQDVVLAEEFSVLRELLKTDFPQRYILAAEFLSTSRLSNVEVASFLVDEIVKSLCVYFGGKDAFEVGSVQSGTADLIFRPTEGGEVFSQLVSLCAEPAVLGDKLLNALTTVSADASEHSQSVLSMETELLIMAHECHTTACNMEGISNVLRVARICVQFLSAANQYQLMMRLLTGIGRYNEMTYIFDALQQHHQFEMLLRKGIDKEDKLKAAILDYLKRFHNEDKDTYSMVALNFSMYREIAQMLDESGHRQLTMLKDKTLDNNKDIQDALKKCIQFFGDAAESYAKDKCYVHAQKCLSWARLVNLQLHLLGSGVKVINLTTDEVKAFAAAHPKFLEVYAVTVAYGETVDWSESLLAHVVVSGDMRYLQEFKSYIKLSPSLIEATLYKLRQAPGKLTSCLPQVKKLLKMCSDIWTQYKIAQDLGLQEVVKELLRGDSSSSYIKDLLHNS